MAALLQKEIIHFQRIPAASFGLDDGLHEEPESRDDLIKIFARRSKCSALIRGWCAWGLKKNWFRWASKAAVEFEYGDNRTCCSCWMRREQTVWSEEENVDFRNDVETKFPGLPFFFDSSDDDESMS